MLDNSSVFARNARWFLDSNARVDGERRQGEERHSHRVRPVLHPTHKRSPPFLVDALCRYARVRKSKRRADAPRRYLCL